MSPGNIPSSEQRIVIEGNGIIILYRERTCSKMRFFERSKNGIWKNTRPLSFKRSDFQRFDERAAKLILYIHVTRSKRISILPKKTTFQFFSTFFYFFLLSRRGNDDSWNGKITIKYDREWFIKGLEGRDNFPRGDASEYRRVRSANI